MLISALAASYYISSFLFFKSIFNNRIIFFCHISTLDLIFSDSFSDCHHDLI